MWLVKDAKRSQVLSGSAPEHDLEVVMEQKPMDMRELAARINRMGSLISWGRRTYLYRPIIEDTVTVPLYTPAGMNRQRAACVRQPCI